MAASLAAGIGVLLAAFERPGGAERPALTRLSIVVLAGCAATLAVGLASEIGDW